MCGGGGGSLGRCMSYVWGALATSNNTRTYCMYMLCHIVLVGYYTGVAQRRVV